MTGNEWMIPGAVVMLIVCLSGAAAEPVFENLGTPVTDRRVNLQPRSDTYSFTTGGSTRRFATRDPDGYWLVWAGFEGHNTRALLGIRLDNGHVRRVDLSEYGSEGLSGHVQYVLGRDGNIYIYTGKPGHFLKYDITKRELIDLGCPAENAWYVGVGALGPDGRFYIGTHPATILVSCDTRTGEITSHGRIADDPKQKYIWHELAVTEDTVYCPVGHYRKELYAYDLQTGETRQLLPPEITKLQGSPTIWQGENGRVYGEAGDRVFECFPDRVEFRDEVPPDAPPEELIVNGVKPLAIDSEGVMRLRDIDSGEIITQQTDYAGRALRLYSVADSAWGRIWGGTMFPAQVFSYDPESGSFTDHRRRSGGRIQVYDILPTDEGLLISSYVRAHLSLYDPNSPIVAGENPYHFETCPGQERPIQWCMGPDGRAYIGTRPVKARVGGALARVDFEKRQVKWWPDVVEHHSVLGCAPVRETGEILCTTSSYGGTGSTPVAEQGCVFLWDCENEEITHIDHPEPGTTSYWGAVRAQNGLIYSTIDREKYFAYDPVARETVFIGNLPEGELHFPRLCDGSVGPDGGIYTMIGDGIYRIDPDDHGISLIGRHEAINDAHGFYVSEDGMLYFGSGTHLWRCRLNIDTPE
ncbi:MAG: hypothetical protein ACLFWB_02335 [Armatimonadota bacterium]